MSDYMITTMDNPWNPFTSFKEWYDWDKRFGYNTCEWIDKFVKTSIDLDLETNKRITEDGINDFLGFNPYGIHFKVYKDEADNLIPLANEAFRVSNS